MCVCVCVCACACNGWFGFLKQNERRQELVERKREMNKMIQCRVTGKITKRRRKRIKKEERNDLNERKKLTERQRSRQRLPDR